MLHHVFHATLVVVGEVACRATDAHVLNLVSVLQERTWQHEETSTIRARSTFKQFSVVLSSVSKADETEALARGRSKT